MSKSNGIKWTKQAIFNALGGQISKTCIVKRDGDWVVRGKHCIISPFEDGTWDIWLCQPDNLGKQKEIAALPNDPGESGYRFLKPRERFVNFRIRELEKATEECSFTIVTDEAWALVSSIDFIARDRRLCKLLGIKRKRLLSAANRKALVDRLAVARKAKSAPPKKKAA